MLISAVLWCTEAGCGIICDDLNSNSDENGSLPQKSEYTSAPVCVCECACGAECDGNLVYERINRRLFSVLISASASKGLSVYLSLLHTHSYTMHFSLLHTHIESSLSSEEEPIVCDES